MTPPLKLLEQTFFVAVDAAHPGKHLAGYLPDLPKGRVVVVGAGKAAARMAAAAEARYGPELQRLEGLVVTRHGHAVPTQKIAVVEAAHPVPDAAGRRATERVLELARGLGADDLLLCFISGGGSALLTAPAGITLAQKAALTHELLRSGADIAEMNTVRKHLSRVKGGRLAAAAAPARVVTLILSDVAGDSFSTIASGPTAPDATTFADALEVLDRYAVNAPAARAFLEAGARGEVPETPKPGDKAFERVSNVLVGNAQRSLEAAARFLETRGVAAHVLSSSVTGEAREAAKTHAAIARQVVQHGQPFTKPCALLSGGETTVTVRGPGRGGRNGEFALALALELDGLAGVYALAADTDGIDGSENNAGAFVTPEVLVGRARARELLTRNDSYTFFEEARTLFVTGPTGTNVNDLRIILVL